MSPRVVATCLYLLSGCAFSMRKPAPQAGLDDVQIPAQMASKHSSEWGGAQCFWNGATEQCLALQVARPQEAPKSMCEPTRFLYPGGSSSYQSGLTESECKARVGIEGVPCEWDGYDCYEASCYLARDQGSCESSPLPCRWYRNSDNLTQSYCTDKNTYCSDHADQTACLADENKCSWSYSSCRSQSCSSFRNLTSCATGSSAITQRRRRTYLSYHDRESRCWWDDSRKWGPGDCRTASYGCQSYSDQFACDTDGAKWGACQWSVRVGECLGMDSCEDYDAESACTADAFAVGEKTFPGATCWWKPGPNLTVGPALRIDFWNQVPTSQNLVVNGDRTLKALNSSDDWRLANHLGLRESWYERHLPVQKVLAADGTAKNWSDIPSPIPDGYQLIFASCQDNLPPRTKSPYDLKGACNHHSQATCATATKLYPCPSYCGWATCWISACSDRCSSCE